MRRMLVLFMGLMLGCSSCSNDPGNKPEPPLPDPNLNPDGLQKLTVQSYPQDTLTSDMKLSEDDRRLVVCNLNSTIAIHYTRTMERLALIDLGPTSQYKVEGYCRVSIIGGYAYVHFGDTGRTHPRIFKVDILEGKLVAAWEIPPPQLGKSNLYDLSSFDIDGKQFEGYVPTKDVDKALMIQGLTKKYELKDPNAGISSYYLDLTTGKASRDVVHSVPDLKANNIYGAFDQGTKVFGEIYYHSYRPDLNSSVEGFILNLETKELTKTPFFGHNMLFVDEGHRRLFLGFNMSAGWSVRDLDTGKELYLHPYPRALWQEDIIALDEKRVAILQSPGTPNPLSIMTIVDVESGQGVASAYLTDQAANCATLSKDGRKMYVGAFRTIFSVDIPPAK